MSCRIRNDGWMSRVSDDRRCRTRRARPPARRSRGRRGASRAPRHRRRRSGVPRTDAESTGLRVARAVRAGGRRTADVDVRQRAHVAKRPAALVEPERELAVARARRHGRRCAPSASSEKSAGSAGDVDERARRVGQIGEGVTRAECLHASGLREHAPDVVDRCRADDLSVRCIRRSLPSCGSSLILSRRVAAQFVASAARRCEAVAMCAAIAEAAASSSAAAIAR